MSLMLKALTRIEEKKGDPAVAPRPLPSSSAPVRPATAARVVDEPPSPPRRMPAERTLTQAERILKQVTAETAPYVPQPEPPVRRAVTAPDDAKPARLTRRVTEELPATDSPPPANWPPVHESVIHTVAAEIDAGGTWCYSALFRTPPDFASEVVEPAACRFDGEPSVFLASTATVAPRDIESSVRLYIAQEYDWGSSTCIESPPAETATLIEPPAWNEPWLDQIEQRLPAIGRPSSPGGPVAIPEKKRRQCEAVAERLLRDSVGLETAVWLFCAVDSHAPTSQVLGPLATVFAELDAGRVLLIDARAAGSGTTDYFSPGGETGLADYLRGDAAWDQLPVAELAASLSLLPGGSWTTGDVNWPDGDAARRRWSKLKQQFRFILIDASGLPSEVARPLVSVCDSVYLMVTLEQTTQDDTQSTAKAIRAAGGHLGGCLLVYPQAAA